MAPFTVTPPSVAMVSVSPLTDAGLIAPVMSDDMTVPDTTWSVRIEVSLALFSGLTRLSTVPAGSLAKASSEGANTVNGPAPFSVSPRSAAVTAATSVLKLPAATAVSTMSRNAVVVAMMFSFGSRGDHQMACHDDCAMRGKAKEKAGAVI